MITVDGFIRPTFNEILTEVQTNAISKFDDGGENTPSVEPESWLGGMTAVIAKVKDDLYQVAEDVYYSLFISVSSGVSLDRAAEPTKRIDEKKSIATVEIVGDIGFVVPQGFVGEREDGIQYATTSPLTLTTGTEQVQVQALEAGTGGNAPVGAIKFIPVPLDEVLSMVSVTPASGGDVIETDSSLRERAISDRAADRTSSLQSIENRVREVTDVIDVRGFENTDKEPVEGRPGVSFEIVVDGGTDFNVADAIFKSKSAGIETFGDIIVPITAPNNQIFNIGFSRVTKRLIHYRVALVITGDYNATASEAFIKQALLDYTGGVNPDGDESKGTKIGEDIEHWKAQASLFDPTGEFGLTGVKSLELFLDFSAPANGQIDLDIVDKEQGFTDFANVTIETTPAP